MAIDHMEHEQSSQSVQKPAKTPIYAYWAFIAASIVSSVATVSVVMLISKHLYQHSDLSAVMAVHSSLLSVQIVFWIALGLGVLGVVFWAVMIRQKSVNDLRIASMKLELAEMALRSEQRLKTIST